MKEIKAVIGKNFGDEGKGRVVDLLCSEALQKGSRALVIRHNGGAQAGHTVEDGTGRFVFHQLGSGSRKGVPVYWSRTFYPDLLKLGEEAEEFASVQKSAGTEGEDIVIYADGNCVCVTVYDVLLNCLAEELRGSARHGSCGMGIYEAVLRSRRDNNPKPIFCLKDLEHKNPAEVTELLRAVRDGYVSGRLEELRREGKQSGYPAEAHERAEGNWEDNEWIRLIWNEELLYNAADMMWENFNRYIVLAEPEQILADYDTIIFENAQGLMLDEDNKEYYPHLTPSHTGLYNIVDFLDKNGITSQDTLPQTVVDIHYVTRTYVTRHGAGRLDHECRKEDINPLMKDLTNVTNHWQSQLRYGKHPPADRFIQVMENDLRNLNKISCRKGQAVPEINITIEITHLDETDGKIVCCDRCRTLREFEDDYMKKWGDKYRLKVRYLDNQLLPAIRSWHGAV